MKLALTESIDQERARFANIASTNPEKAKAIYAIGESMKTYSSSGELSKFRRLINETPKEDILIYFTSKAFEAAINAGNLIISSFMVDQGYPLNSEALPSSMHSAIQTLEDDTCVPVLHFLISKGANVNRQVFY